MAPSSGRALSGCPSEPTRVKTSCCSCDPLCPNPNPCMLCARHSARGVLRTRTLVVEPSSPYSATLLGLTKVIAFCITRCTRCVLESARRRWRRSRPKASSSDLFPSPRQRVHEYLMIDFSSRDRRARIDASAPARAQVRPRADPVALERLFVCHRRCTSSSAGSLPQDG